MIIKHHALSDTESTIKIKAFTTFGEREMIFNCTQEQYVKGLVAYKSGALMQNAFPFLTTEEREFLINGTTAE